MHPFQGVYKPDPKEFFSYDKSRGSNHQVKNEEFLHCRFSLNPHMARLRAGRVKIYNVKSPHFCGDAPQVVMHHRW